MVVEVMNQSHEEAAFIRPYVECAKNLAFEKYDNLEDYSPLAFSVLQQTLTTAKDLTPQFVQDKVEEYAGTLDDYVDATDGLLTSAMEKTKEFPEMLEKVKGKLSVEEFWLLLALVGDNVSGSKQELAKFLPSASLEDLLMKARVQEIVGKVLSQPQLFKNQAVNFADDVADRLDFNKDGKVSIGDLAGSICLDISSGVTNYCSILLSAVLAPLPSRDEISTLMTTLLENPKVKPFVSSIGAMESYLELFQPLWVATNILKAYVSRYTTNVQDKITPLTPYLTSLIQETSVTELPFELLSLTKSTAGLNQDEDTAKVASETRALLWALVDISFILEALKESSAGAGSQVHGIEGVTTISDADALKDGSWAKGFSELDFS